MAVPKALYFHLKSCLFYLPSLSGYLTSFKRLTFPCIIKLIRSLKASFSAQPAASSLQPPQPRLAPPRLCSKAQARSAWATCPWALRLRAAWPLRARCHSWHVSTFLKSQRGPRNRIKKREFKYEATALAGLPALAGKGLGLRLHLRRLFPARFCNVRAVHTRRPFLAACWKGKTVKSA